MRTYGLGRMRSLQVDVLDLGGALCGVPSDIAKEEDRIEAMRQALQSLKEETGEDFGYNIEKWHNYLQSSDEFKKAYTFRSGWDEVCAGVKELVADKDHSRRVELAQQTMDEEM